MDGKRNKCDTSCSDGVDRISQLPDDIILIILSNLKLDNAARTSALSTRWYDLWRCITTLDLFDRRFYTRVFGGNSSWDEERRNYTEWVNSIVEKNKVHSLKKMVILYNLDKSSHSTITKWLEFAFSKRVEELKLSFHIKQNAVVLDELLRLRPSNLLKSSNLRSLHLTGMKVSGEAIKLILRDCHLLERLMIWNVVFTSDIEVCGGATSLVLKHLEIGCCDSGKSIKVSAPNLTYFEINGTQEMFGGAGYLKKCFITQLQILTISLFKPGDILAKEIPTMPKLTELNFTCYNGRSKYLLASVTSFIRASPLLQTLNLQFLELDGIIEEDVEIVKVEAFKHHNLRVFKFFVYDVYITDHMELVSFILDNCVALRKLYIDVYKTKGNLRAVQEADTEKLEQLLQPKIPTYIQLRVRALSVD